MFNIGESSVSLASEDGNDEFEREIESRDEIGKSTSHYELPAVNLVAYLILLPSTFRTGYYLDWLLEPHLLNW